MQRFRGTALFGHDRLPLLNHLSRHWGGMSLPYPGSGGPLTFLQPSPFASAEFAGAEYAGRTDEPVTTKTLDLEAPARISATTHAPRPSAGETGRRMTTERTIIPPAPVASGAGSVIVQRRKSQSEPPSPDPGNEPPARPPEATVTETAASVETKTRTAVVAPTETQTQPAESSFLGSLPVSPTGGDLGRPIIRRRKHRSPEASPRTIASVTTETEPPLRVGPQFSKADDTIRRTALPLPVAGTRHPSTSVSAPAAPATTTSSVTPDRPSGPAASPRSESIRPEEPSSIVTAATITPQGDLGTAIQLRHATTAIAKNPRPTPASMALPQQSGRSRIDRSEANIGIFAGTRPGTSTRNAPETIAASPAIAFPIPEPHAAAVRTLAEQPISASAPAHRSRSAGRLAPAMPDAEIGAADTLSPARAPMPLVVQREPQHFSAEQSPRQPSPTAPWQTGNVGHSSPAIGGHRGPTGHGSGSATVVSVDDLGVGTEVEPNAPQAGDGERPNVDELVDKVFRMLMRRLAVERERRGQQPWF